MIKQHMKGESCTTGRSVVLRAENGSTRENQEVNRGETESSDSRSSCKTNYGIAENLFQHIQTESRGGHEHSCETRRETELSSRKPSRKISGTAQKEKFKNSVSSKACCRSYESRENSNEHFSVNPWAILDRPHTTGQRETHQIETDKEFEIEKCNGEENTELRFNTRMKTQPARGHIVHSSLMGRPSRHGNTRTRSHVAATAGRLLQVTNSELSVIWHQGWKECGLRHHH